MKKALLILAITFGIQVVSAHPGGVNHTHHSFLQEWSWVLIPAVIGALVYLYYRKRNAIVKRR